MPKEESYRSGFVTILGRPNVGKSTLLNQLAGQKVAIMSDKPQTTRNKIQAVLTRENVQIVFIDTPGMHKPKHKLGEFMVGEVYRALEEVEAVLFVLDASEEIGGGDRFVAGALTKIDTPIFVLLNKVDLISSERLAQVQEEVKDLGKFARVIPLSAKTGENIEFLIQELISLLPQGPQYYPEDMVTDQPERLIIAEMIREKALQLTREEVPHAIGVEVEEVTKRPKKETIYVRAVIYVERESQKGIVVGKKGALLKQIGQLARTDVENLLGSPIFLDLWVKVKEDWRNRENMLHFLGYE